MRGNHWTTTRTETTHWIHVGSSGCMRRRRRRSHTTHRHDFRTDIASDMYLKHFVRDASKKMELLIMLYLCYWRWPTRSVLCYTTQPLSCMEEFLFADSDRRAFIRLEAFSELEREMGSYQVIGFREEFRMDLLLRNESKRLTGIAKSCFWLPNLLKPCEPLRWCL